MAVPTISSVSPATGPSGGEIIVEVAGTNFRLPDPPPATGPVPRPEFTTVEILFGTTPATRSAALSSVLAIARLPIHDPEAVDVTIRNLDNDGVPIAGETATSAAAFTFQRPQIAGGVESDGRIQNVVKRLILELRRQIIEEVVHVWNTDWTDSPDDVIRETRIAKLPALLLIGPTGQFNRFFRSQARRRIQESEELVKLRRNALTMDLEFDVGVVTNHGGQALRLMELASQFFHRTPWLTCDRDPNDPSQGEIRYEMDLTDAPSMGRRPSESNVKDASLTIVVRGVEIGLIPGVPDDLVTDRTRVLTVDPTFEIQQTE
jgi:hypothetical protein